MLAGLDPLSLLELDGPLFDALERALAEALSAGGAEHEAGNGTPATPALGALAFATEYGPGRRDA